MSQNRKIIHVDMDCFYAAIETRERPELRGRPIAVGGDPNRRGVVATANYEARRFGVHSALASATAVRRCPHLILIPPRISLYREESQRIRNIFETFTDRIEPLSLDEAYLDVTGSPHCQGSATLIATEIRRQIKATTGLTASAGVAPNKFLAKVASDFDKPDGLTVVRPSEVATFVAALPVESIPGVGEVTASRMHDRELRTCTDLQALTLRELVELFGRQGRRLHDLCRGIDRRPVRTERTPKSLSVENTYARDLPDEQACLARVPELLDELTRRLRRRDSLPPVSGLFVKVKFDDFRQTTLESSDYREPSLTAYETLLAEALTRHERPVRLLGIGLRLDAAQQGLPVQLELFRPQASALRPLS